MCCGIIRGRNFGCICIRSGSFIPGRIKSSRRARAPRLKDRGAARSGWEVTVLNENLGACTVGMLASSAPSEPAGAAAAAARRRAVSAAVHVPMGVHSMQTLRYTIVHVHVLAMSGPPPRYI